MYPKTLEKLIEAFRILPGVGEKTAERYAMHVLDQSSEKVEDLSKQLIEAKENVRPCQICFNLTDHDVCDICADKERNQSVICVVSNPKEAFSIERMGEYNGLYHVLGGLISTKKGILPDNLNINQLNKRINAETKEVILALNATVEGEMTSLYLSKKLREHVKVTRLAFGLPIGGHLDYADEMTLMKAFEGRNDME